MLPFSKKDDNSVVGGYKLSPLKLQKYYYKNCHSHYNKWLISEQIGTTRSPALSIKVCEVFIYLFITIILGSSLFHHGGFQSKSTWGSKLRQELYSDLCLLDITTLLVLPGSRQEETLHWCPVPHEWRMARGTGMSAFRSDGARLGEQENWYTARLRVGTHTLW